MDQNIDKDLILLWQNGDDSAFEKLYHRYAVDLLRAAMQKTNNREESKELVQNTFITLFKSKATAHEIKSPMAYLYTVLKNRLFDQFRHDLIHKKFEEHIIYRQKYLEENNVSNYIESKEMENMLLQEVNKLPNQCRNVFQMRREQEMSNKEIASSLNISENTVEQHMRKALRILKTAFGILRNNHSI